MIRVEHLTKRFPGCVAVDDVTFAVEAGEIVGLLGPNGAGKTTTMRILAAFIPPTAGRVSVAGFDVFTHSLEARRRIGYLPENVPLYPEMRVDEYLHYRAGLKGLSRRHARRRVEAVKEQCGLADMGRRIIGHLSKGYRQRVGLADALVHDPDVLILDEPTIGLDPNQIREIRELIRGLARRHTVLISSHILPEVEMTCGRVLIMNRGRIAASGTPQMLHGLLHGHRAVRMEARGISPHLLARLRAISGVVHVETHALDDGWTQLTLACDPARDVRADVFQACAGAQAVVRELHAENATLEDVFVQITQDEERPA
jgi:ABC-2 type transport system ATP-binding protein